MPRYMGDVGRRCKLSVPSYVPGVDIWGQDLISISSDEVVCVGDWVAVTKESDGELLSEGEVLDVTRSDGETLVRWHEFWPPGGEVITSVVPPAFGLVLRVRRDGQTCRVTRKPEPTFVEALADQAVKSVKAKNSDADKVRERQKQLEERLCQDIRAAGEGGWGSPFYTGSPGMLSGYAEEYREWKKARDAYAVSGKDEDKEAMLAWVDFENCPPKPFKEKVSARPSVGEVTLAELCRGIVNQAKRSPVLTVVVIWAVVLFIMFKLGWV